MARKRSTPAPTLVLLVRHGQTPTTGTTLPGRAKGLHLADSGVAQAEAAAQRIAKLSKIAAVYASPLERTRETAAPIARERKLKVQINRGLLECDFGDWTGKKLDALRKLPEWTTVQRYPSGFRFPGGESFAEMQTRIVGAPKTDERAERKSHQHPIVLGNRTSIQNILPNVDPPLPIRLGIEDHHRSASRAAGPMVATVLVRWVTVMLGYPGNLIADPLGE